MMTAQAQLHYPTCYETTLTTPDILFLSNFEFSNEDLLKELPQEAILLLHSLIEQYNNKESSFFETLNDRKKWDAALKKYAHLKVKGAQFEQYFTEVSAFFAQTTSFSLLCDMTCYFALATYETDEESSWFSFDAFNGDAVAFTADRVDGQGIVFYGTEDDEIVMSPQALLYARMLDVASMQQLKEFKLGAQVDSTMPLHAQLLLHVCNDDKKAIKYLTELKQPLTSILKSVVVYNKLFRFLEDTYANTSDEEVSRIIPLYCAQLSQRLYRNTSVCYSYYTKTKYERDEKLTASTKKKLEEALEKLEKQKEQNKELQKQQKELKKQQREIEQQPKQVVEQTENNHQAQQVKDELNKLQQLYKILEKDKLNQETKFQQEIQFYKQDNSTLNKKLDVLTKSSSQPQITTIAQWLELGRELIQNISDIEEQEIREFFELFLKVCDEQKALRPKVELATNLFGYVSVRTDGHYVKFGNGKEVMICGIPEKVYLADGQFVQVTENFEYVQDYPDFLDVSLNGQTMCFSVVKMKDSVPYVYSKGELKPINHEAHIQLRDGQMVSFNSQLQLIRFYKQQRLQLNVFEQSIKLKKHDPYYVQKVLPTGAVVTHAFTNVESFMTFDQLENLQDGQLVTAKGNEVVRLFYGAFYKLSSYYKKSEIVSICEADDAYFGKKVNREMVIIHSVPPTMTLAIGDMVRIDEGHHFLEIVRDESGQETLEQRLARRPVATQKEEVIAITPPEFTTPILIIGNPTVFESYEQLLSYGYEVEAVSGFESIAKIKQAAKGKERIIVCTGYVSHDNMFAIKAAYPANQVIYAERDGATQIAVELKNSNL